MDATLARSLWQYDAENGRLLWIRPPKGGRAREGSEAGTIDVYGYRVVRYKGKGYKVHRIVWLMVTGEFPEGVIDHIDGDRQNNRWTNLRDVSWLENSHNSRPRGGLSGVRGVSWFSQYGKWKASFTLAGVHYFVGYYDSVDPARAALERARGKTIGELRQMGLLSDLMAESLAKGSEMRTTDETAFEEVKK